MTAWRAGHVLGAAMFMVEIAGMRALYTGDYSRLADRHMSAADLPSPPPHIGANRRFAETPKCIYALACIFMLSTAVQLYARIPVASFMLFSVVYVTVHALSTLVDHSAAGRP